MIVIAFAIEVKHFGIVMIIVAIKGSAFAIRVNAIAIIVIAIKIGVMHLQL
jgi:hypothetical protein